LGSWLVSTITSCCVGAVRKDKMKGGKGNAMLELWLEDYAAFKRLGKGLV